MTKQLAQRFQSAADHLRQNIKYETLIDFGSPLPKIKALLEKLDADIVVFGPHKFFHKTTWRFGKLSYQSMLSLNSGVLIIPEKTAG